jgi:hypothetical protein
MRDSIFVQIVAEIVSTDSPPGSMALLGGTSLVFSKPLANEVEERADPGPSPGLAQGIVGGPTSRMAFLTVPRS